MFNISRLENSPEKIIKRLNESHLSLSTKFTITVFDQFGLKVTGNFNSFDESTNILSLKIDDNILFFNIKFLAHLMLHDSDKHEEFLSGKEPSKVKVNNSNINLDEKIDLLLQMLSKNYDLPLKIKIEEVNKLNNKNKENISTLIDCLSNSLTALANDEFSLSQLKEINAINIKYNKDIKFSMRTSNSEVYVSVNYDDELPTGLNNLIEKGFNKVL